MRAKFIYESLKNIYFIFEDKIGVYSYIDEYTGNTLYGDVYKNPENLNIFKDSVRGISDLKGNLYIMSNSKLIHKRLLDFLNRRGIVTNAIWNRTNYSYDNILTWQRKGDENTMYLGESYINSDINNIKGFNEMFNKVKEKNKNINFIKISISNDRRIY